MKTLFLKTDLKHVIVKEALRKLIVKGKYKPGALLPSQNELSAEFGVGHNTVREAVTALVHEGLAYRIQGAGTFVSKAVNVSAPLKGYIGIAFPGTNDDPASHPAYYRLLLRLEQLFGAQGYELAFTTCRLNDNRMDYYGCKLLAKKNLAGLLVCGAIGTEDIYRQITAAHIPLLIYNNCLRAKSISSVDIDRESAAARCAELIRTKGYRCLWLATRREWRHLPSVAALFQGFWATWSATGVAAQCQELLLGHDLGLEWQRFLNQEQENILKTPTALFVSTDILLPSLTHALLMKSKLIPQLGITVFYEADYPLPNCLLATIAYDPDLLAATIARKMIALVRRHKGGAGHTLIPTRLAIQSSENSQP